MKAAQCILMYCHAACKYGPMRRVLQDMERRGTFDEEQMIEARKNTAMSMEAMKEAAYSKKPAHLLQK